MLTIGPTPLPTTSGGPVMVEPLEMATRLLLPLLTATEPPMNDAKGLVEVLVMIAPSAMLNAVVSWMRIVDGADTRYGPLSSSRALDCPVSENMRSSEPP